MTRRDGRHVVFALSGLNQNDRILERDQLHDETYFGYVFKPLVHTLEARGFTIDTPSTFAKRTPTPRAVLVSENGRGRSLLSASMPGAIVFSHEPPLVAKTYYATYRRGTHGFDTIFDWEGAQVRAPETARFVPAWWPGHGERVLGTNAWHDRRFAVMIQSNKQLTNLSWTHGRAFDPSSLPGRVVHDVRSLAIRAIDPWFRTELISYRLHVAKRFARVPGFDLFGGAWDQHQQVHALGVWRGTITSSIRAKREAYANYRFALCIENTAFPGYLTEKIHDALLGDAIPVYYGDPLVTKRLPREVFIHARDYPTLDDLVERLLGVSEREGRAYLDAGRAYVDSAAYAETFGIEAYVGVFVEAIERVHANL